MSDWLGPDLDGATPLEDDIEGLRLSFISSRSQLDAAEYANIADADRWLRRSRVTTNRLLTTGFLCELHKNMFGQVWDWAGTWRKRATNIGVDWSQISLQTTDAMNDALYWHSHQSFPPDELAVRLHHRLVSIHPFPNGNGRATRTIADLYLTTVKEPILTWGSANLGTPSETRRQYIQTLIEIDQTGNYQPLLEFARK